VGGDGEGRLTDPEEDREEEKATSVSAHGSTPAVLQHNYVIFIT
jgi:hypothetical protein